MKKFLVGIVIIIIASIGFNLKPDKRDQAVVVQEEPVVKKEEVITYKELLEYLDIFKTGENVSIRMMRYYSSTTIEKGCDDYITFFFWFVERPHNLYIQIM